MSLDEARLVSHRGAAYRADSTGQLLYLCDEQGDLWKVLDPACGRGESAPAALLLPDSRQHTNCRMAADWQPIERVLA